MHLLFETIILIPNFFKHAIALNTSSDLSKFLALDTPIDCDASNNHLIEILLSPSISMAFLNLLKKLHLI